MSDECKEILHYYSGNHYKFINDFLLMDFEDEFKKKYKYYDEPFCQEKIRKIDDCFDKDAVAQINEDNDAFYVYRGVKTRVDLQIGESFLLKNFTSTTTNLGVARIFTSDSKKANACCLYRLRLGRGIPYIDMRPFSKVKTEDEILLPRNLIMTYQGDSIIRDERPDGSNAVGLLSYSSAKRGRRRSPEEYEKNNRNITVNDFIITKLNEASIDMSSSTASPKKTKSKNNTRKKSNS